jgi:hypothetical protein
MEKKGSARSKREREGGRWKNTDECRKTRELKKMCNRAKKASELIKKENDSFLEENRKLVQAEDDYLE